MFYEETRSGGLEFYPFSGYIKELMIIKIQNYLIKHGIDELIDRPPESFVVTPEIKRGQSS
jgi:hypothetical protein